MIYFVRAGQDGPVKIGFTRDHITLKRRIARLQTGCPAPLNLLGTAPGELADEASLHRFFKARHQHGEWFEHCSGIDVVVRQVCVERQPVAECIRAHRLRIARDRAYSRFTAEQKKTLFHELAESILHPDSHQPSQAFLRYQRACRAAQSAIE